jgi:hypothetical protein
LRDQAYPLTLTTWERATDSNGVETAESYTVQILPPVISERLPDGTDGSGNHRTERVYYLNMEEVLKA